MSISFILAIRWPELICGSNEQFTSPDIAIQFTLFFIFASKWAFIWSSESQLIVVRKLNESSEQVRIYAKQKPVMFLPA